MKTILIVFVVIFALGLLGGIIAFVVTGNIANSDEYILGNDTIKSIKAVVEKRQINSVSTEISNGIITKRMEYKSSTVQDDLLQYTQYLRNEAGFCLTKDMDLSVIPSMVELGKASEDLGQLIIMTIDYNSSGYTVIIKKGQGTLTIN